MAGSVESVAVYRRNAANCVEMPRNFPNPKANSYYSIWLGLG